MKNMRFGRLRLHLYDEEDSARERFGSSQYHAHVVLPNGIGVLVNYWPRQFHHASNKALVSLLTPNKDGKLEQDMALMQEVKGTMDVVNDLHLSPEEFERVMKDLASRPMHPNATQEEAAQFRAKDEWTAIDPATWEGPAETFMDRPDDRDILAMPMQFDRHLRSGAGKLPTPNAEDLARLIKEARPAGRLPSSSFASSVSLAEANAAGADLRTPSYEPRLPDASPVIMTEHQPDGILTPPLEKISTPPVSQGSLPDLTGDELREALGDNVLVFGLPANLSAAFQPLMFSMAGVLRDERVTPDFSETIRFHTNRRDFLPEDPSYQETLERITEEVSKNKAVAAKNMDLILDHTTRHGVEESTEKLFLATVAQAPDAIKTETLQNWIEDITQRDESERTFHPARVIHMMNVILPLRGDMATDLMDGLKTIARKFPENTEAQELYATAQAFSPKSEGSHLTRLMNRVLRRVAPTETQERG